MRGRENSRDEILVIAGVLSGSPTATILLSLSQDTCCGWDDNLVLSYNCMSYISAGIHEGNGFFRSLVLLMHISETSDLEFVSACTLSHTSVYPLSIPIY